MIVLSHLIHSQLGIYLNYNYFMAPFTWFKGDSNPNNKYVLLKRAL